MFEYNTDRSKLILKEYGRNVQNLAEYINTIEDRTKKNQYAHTLIELMRQLNPSVKDDQEITQKLWDDLFIMTEFRLDVDSPYPKPEPDVLFKKPKKLDYNTDPVEFKLYGKNIEKLIDKASAIEDEEEQKGAIIYLGKLMKNFYMSWNRENIEDEVIIRHLKEMSGNKLDMPIEEIKKNNLFDINFSKPRSSNNNNSNSNKGRRSGPKRKKN